MSDEPLSAPDAERRLALTRSDAEKVGALRALHVSTVDMWGATYCDDDHQDWPCKTIRIIGESAATVMLRHR